MFTRRSDLPLDEDGLSRFLPWLIAFMVFLSALAMAGTLVLSAIAERWDSGVSGTLTVQVAPSQGAKAEARDKQALDRAVKFLRAEKGVIDAEPISEGRILSLLEPWLGPGLGAGGIAGDLPLPMLIDVNIDENVDVEALGNRLRKQVPAASIDDHGAWLDRLVGLIRTMEAVTVTVLALIILATIGTVVFTTRTGLTVHQGAIEVLHFIGARDAYVAKQFAHRALSLGLRGGVFGLALALPTLWGIGWLAGRMEAGLIPDVTLTPVHWGVLAALPVAAGLIAMLTARVTVLKTLAKML